jgi:hypothetical protein
MPHAGICVFTWYKFKCPMLSQKKFGYQEIQLTFKGLSERFITIPGNLMGNSGITHSGDDELMTVSGVSLS